MDERITPRSFAAGLPGDIPRHWLPGNEFVSSLLNAYTILVPANEAFYIRTLNACLPHVRDETLLGRCQDFIRQEAQHSVAHKRYWRKLPRQADISKVELSACRMRYSAGVSPPRESWGLSSL